MKKTLSVFASLTGNKDLVWSRVSAVFPPDCYYRRLLSVFLMTFRDALLILLFPREETVDREMC